jgi:hypothetical protein
VQRSILPGEGFPLPLTGARRYARARAHSGHA